MDERQTPSDQTQNNPPQQPPQSVQPGAEGSQNTAQNNSQNHAPVNTASQPNATQVNAQNNPPASTEQSAMPAGNWTYSSNPFKAAGKGLGTLLSNNPVSTFTVSLIGILIVLVMAFTGGFLGAVLGESAGAIMSILFFIIGVVLFFRILAASYVLFLQSDEGNEITGRQALGKYASSNFLSFVGAFILMMLASTAGFILLVIPGVIIFTKLSLAPFAIYKEGLGAVDALKRSWSLTKGHFWEVLSANIAQAVITGNSLLSTTGGVTAIGNRYVELVKAEDSGQGTGKTHWLNFLLPILVGLVLAGYFGLIFFMGAASSNLNGFDDYNTGGNSIQLESQGSDFDLDSNMEDVSSYCYFGSDDSFESFECVTESECAEVAKCAEDYEL